MRIKQASESTQLWPRVPMVEGSHHLKRPGCKSDHGSFHSSTKLNFINVKKRKRNDKNTCCGIPDDCLHSGWTQVLAELQALQNLKRYPLQLFQPEEHAQEPKKTNVKAKTIVLSVPQGESGASQHSAFCVSLMKWTSDNLPAVPATCPEGARRWDLSASELLR